MQVVSGVAPVTDQEKKPSFGEAIDLLVNTLKAFDGKQQQTLLATVSALLDLKVDTAKSHATPAAGNSSVPQPQLATQLGTTGTASNGERRSDQGTDIRSLKEEKSPKSATQMAAIVGYYLKELAPESERRSTIRTSDLETYFKQAKFALPKKMEQVLIDSKRAGYFEAEARGEYKLTRVGHNLVVHRLPEA